MPDPLKIGRAELEILQYVTEHHPVTVRAVADYVAETKGHVRTTVLNIMERLRKKGFLRRKKIEGVYHYAPTVAKGDFLRRMVRDFVEKTLSGSVSPFVAYLADEADLGETDLAELRKLVADLETRKKEQP
jgi:predicted transcriptional regulator